MTTALLRRSGCRQGAISILPRRPATAAVRFTHDEAGLSALVAHLQPLAPALVVLEATGGYEA